MGPSARDCFPDPDVTVSEITTRFKVERFPRNYETNAEEFTDDRQRILLAINRSEGANSWSAPTSRPSS
jgi:hypothetical protein